MTDTAGTPPVTGGLPEAVTDHQVRLGSILFTLIEPHDGHQRAYNRWYERDHFYSGCLTGPHTLAGGRFVATHRMKDLREGPGPGGDPERGSYLSLYWIEEGHHSDWAAWAGNRVHDLHDADRMFAHRDHVHTKLYDLDWAVGRDPDPIPVELALDHPFAGLAVVLGETTGATTPAELDAWYRSEHLPAILPDSPAALVARFSILPMPGDAPDVPDEDADPGHYLQLWFLQDDPGACWDDLLGDHATALARAGVADLILAAPFVPTVPGTDAHVGEL